MLAAVRVSHSDNWNNHKASCLTSWHSSWTTFIYTNSFFSRFLYLVVGTREKWLFNARFANGGTPHETYRERKDIFTLEKLSLILA